MLEYFNYFLNWFLQILIPYLFVIAGFMSLKVGRGQNKFEKAFDVGFDSCILGFGMLAVLLGSKEFEVIVKTEKALAIPLGIGLVTLLGFNVLERYSSYGWITKARLSILAGTFIFGVNTGLLAFLDQKAALPAIFWGALCFILPCLGFWIVLGSKLPQATVPTS